MRTEGGWVRLIDGRLHVTFPAGFPRVPAADRTRPLTRREALAWRVLRRVPEQ